MEWLKVDAASIVALIASLVALWRALRMTPHEEEASDAASQKLRQEAADIAEARANRLAERVEQLERKIDSMEEENRKLLKENKEYLGTLTNWAVGITLLLSQIRANQLTAAWFPIPDTLDKFVEKGKIK